MKLKGVDSTDASKAKDNQNASTGNRTRAARVAGEHSTTEPSMLKHDEASLNHRHPSVVAVDHIQAGQLSVWKPRLVAMKRSVEIVRNHLTTQTDSFKRLNFIW